MTTTDETQWLPLGIEDSDIVEFTAPWIEVPDWFQTSLWEWIDHNIITSGRRGQPVIRTELLRKAERLLHVELPIYPAHQVSSTFGHIKEIYISAPDPMALVGFVDFLMSDLPEGHTYLQELEELLIESGSGWKVGTRRGKPGLLQRLPQGVVDAAAATIQHGKAGKRLATAWEDAFGINPDPSKAYWFAVKSVEDAGAPVVIPNDPGPTLGKVISRIEQGAQFNLPHLREDPRAKTHDILLGMLRMLWVGQYDRHGGLPASPLPDDVTQDEAEAAVLLAVTLVGWFETGKVQQ